MTQPRESVALRVSRELSLPRGQVDGALALFGEGATLPFIARYRKEATGGLDEVQLRDVRDRAAYLEELEERRTAIVDSVREQGALTSELHRSLLAAGTKQELEDLYLPWRPKRRTRATIAVERGLEPLAELIVAGEADDARVRREAATYVTPGGQAGEVPDVEAALEGARDILAERVAEDAPLRRRIRNLTRARGTVFSRLARGKKDDPAAPRFRDYFEHREPVGSIPSHRMLAIRRGETEGVLSWGIEGPEDDILAEVERHVVGRRTAREQLGAVAVDAARRLLGPSIGSELAAELKERADREAIRVFGQNLEQLLLQPPGGERAVLGLDPGFRSGVKVAMVSRTGAVVATDTFPLHQPERFAAGVRALVKRHAPELVAIGNGTASRETEAAVRAVLAEAGAVEPPAVVLVNEAGASVYSASDVAREELPDLDVSIRGAVSIARRLQDPLAELVKIDPRSIGVGQYQHDVHQPSLRKRLDETVELCVNRVGVEVNTASAPLLSYVAGIGPTLAKNIVAARDAGGGMSSRKELLEVPRLGKKAFEQAAGFLRIRGGAHPLDATAVHPERYALVKRMARDLGTTTPKLVGDEAALARLEARLESYVSDDVGLPTLRDILDELRRPGRDPREAFEPPAFRDDVREPKDLKPGMKLEGVVTNVVAFGAFVDVGVHQDGLVHISQLADRFVKDPAEIVKVGQKVRVTVKEVDLARNRIALTMKTGAGVPGKAAGGGSAAGGNDGRSAGGSTGASARRLGMILLTALAGLVSAGGATAQQETAPDPRFGSEPGTELTVYLLTLSPGDAVWERFGHNAIWIEDRGPGPDVAYDWGRFDFDQEDFIPRFVRGEMLYWMARSDPQSMIDAYVRYNRTVKIQELRLTPDQRVRLRDYVEWHALPENRHYRYDYFLDNCSTRVRDALDLALGGLLREAWEGERSRRTWRDMVREVTEVAFGEYLALDILMGPRTDRTVTAWEEAFIPMDLRDRIREVTVPGPDGAPRPLVISEEVYFQADRPDVEGRSRAFLPFVLLLSILLGGGAVLMARAAIGGRRRLRWGVATVAGAWGLVSGVLGALMLFMWLFTEHHFAHRNLNLLQLSPLGLALAVLVPLQVLKESPGGAALRLAGAAVLLSLIGALLAPLPWVAQSSALAIALSLPLHLGVWWSLRMLYSPASPG